MLAAYHETIHRQGLQGEFGFLDSTANFYWVPPGFKLALSYDSVRTILLENAANFASVKLSWKQLKIIVLSENIATYTGIVQGTMTDTLGN